MRSPRRLLLFAVALLCAGALSAQEFRATITGRVVDPSGAGVPGNITVRNIDTNIENAVKAEAGGEFTVPFLRPGNYMIVVEAPGFKKYLQTGITLEVAQKAGFEIKLEVGAQTQSIEVTAQSELLDTETASRSADVDPQQVAELPLNYRNPYSLVTNMPGVQFRGNLSWIRPFDGATNTAWSMNGGIVGKNEILIDGATNTAGSDLAGVGYVPTVDSVSEIKVQTSTYDAQYGRTSGGVSNVSIKTGTNAIHGAGYEYYKRTWLDANTFQNNAIGNPKANHYLDQYGVEVDGPVYIPKIYNGKNKTFFTVSLEGYREASPNPLFDSVPAPEFFNGDFSKLTNSAGAPVTIYDPLTGRADSTSQVGWSRTAFAGNLIPQSRINPTATKILSYAMKPNCTTAGAGYSQSNLCLNDTDADHYHNQLYKIDENINAKNHLFFRYGGYNRVEARPFNGLTTAGADGQLPFSRITNSAIVDWVGTFSPTLIANVHASFTRFIETAYGAANRGFDIAGEFGFPASQINGLPTQRDFGVYGFTNYNGLGRSSTFNVDNDYELNGNVTKIWNRHTFHFGVDARQQNYLIENSGNIFNISAGTDMTQKLYNTSDATSGNAIATFLLGVPQGGGINLPVYPWYKQPYMATFLQDDWKVTPKLTLNLGLRWDLNGPPTEKHDRMNVGFDTTSVSPLASLVNPALFPFTSANLKGGLTFAGVNGASEQVFDNYYKTIQPRIGAAYKITDKIVIRGGYGIYRFAISGNYQNRSGFSSTSTLIGSSDGGKTPISTAFGGFLSNPFPVSSALPLGYAVPTGSSAGLNTAVGQSFNSYNRGMIAPRQDQYSFGIQANVTKGSVLELTYGGSKGRNLEMNGIPYNIPSLAARNNCNILISGVSATSGPNYCNGTIPNPFQGLAPFAVSGSSFYTASTVTRWQLMRPFPQFNGDITQNGTNFGSTQYDSLQVSYKLRIRGGLNLQTNYTFSKWTQTLQFSDPYAGILTHSIAQADEPHVFKLVGLYQLPFGKGKTFLSGANGFVDRLVGGWDLNSNFSFHSGEPLALPGNAIILKNPAPANGVDFSQNQPYLWSNCVIQVNNDGSRTLLNQSTCGTDPSTYSWLTLQTTTYMPNPNPQYSGQMRMSHATSLDASLNKSVRINERFRAQIRLEAFNALNHFTYGDAGVNTTPTSPAFGSFVPHTLGNSASFPRQIQLGFKVLW